MEALVSNINSTCPMAFGGLGGALFAQAVTAVVAAHCSIYDGYQWPADKSEKILNEDNPNYDFVVVGAGTAGSIMASRLSTDFPTQSVLLIEAGYEPGLSSEIPALVFANQDTAIDWRYKTSPDGRSCLGFPNNSCNWSKGRGMGGSSSINAMLYIRGHPNDFDPWVEIGNEGWSYKDLEPYFQKIEDKLQLSSYKNAENPWYNFTTKAWKELGYKPVDVNNTAQIGTRINKLLTRDGKRLNSAKVYLSVQNNNLHVMKNTTVQRINIDSTTNIASGVEIRHESGKYIKIKVNTEVIMSAGSIATPQILMLSGIGPKNHLADNNIECLVDLPVGENLQDHSLLPVFLKTNLHSSNEINSILLQYMLSREGPFSTIGITDFFGFINTENDTYPNVQFHHMAFAENDVILLEVFLKAFGFKDGIKQAITELNKEGDLLLIFPTLLHPKSRGEITLNHSDTKSQPIINTNYFDDPDDLKTLLNGIEFIRKLTETETFKSLGITMASLDIPGCSQFSSHTEEYWECYVRHMSTTVYHPVGTAKMGPKFERGVVSQELLVHGINNLRVVDASVMPTLTSANTMSPTMAIAEKAADIIKKCYKS